MYLEQVEAGRGMQHLSRLWNLRSYIKSTNEDDLMKAIAKLTKLSHLRILVEAGLKPRPMQAVLSRTEELIRRQEGGGT